MKRIAPDVLRVGSSFIGGVRDEVLETRTPIFCLLAIAPAICVMCELLRVYAHLHYSPGTQRCKGIGY